MEIKTNGDYNRCQLNETINLSPDGKVLSKSLMLNLRGETTEEVWKCYQELKGLVEGKEEKPKKKTRKEKEKSEKEPEGIETPTCECGNPMVLRNGKWGPFWSCSAYPICKLTRQFQNKKVEKMPCDEDLAESIPF